jgi:hypothetical protein
MRSRRNPRLYTIPTRGAENGSLLRVDHHYDGTDLEDAEQDHHSPTFAHPGIEKETAP